MKRVISDAEEQSVREYYNRTADSLGISRPLDFVGWFKVKNHLRAKFTEGFPADWTKDETWLHVMACADLVMDPQRELKGLAGYAQLFMLWIGSPSDRHGRLSEISRILVLVFVSGLISVTTLEIGHLLFGFYVDADKIFFGMLFSIFLVGLFISSDTMVGVFGLFILLAGLYSIATEYLEQDWLKMTSTCVSALVGGLMFTACISMRK